MDNKIKSINYGCDTSWCLEGNEEFSKKVNLSLYKMFTAYIIKETGAKVQCRIPFSTEDEKLDIVLLSNKLTEIYNIDSLEDLLWNYRDKGITATRDVRALYMAFTNAVPCMPRGTLDKETVNMFLASVKTYENDVFYLASLGIIAAKNGKFEKIAMRLAQVTYKEPVMFFYALYVMMNDDYFNTLCICKFPELMHHLQYTGDLPIEKNYKVYLWLIDRINAIEKKNDTSGAVAQLYRNLSSLQASHITPNTVKRLSNYGLIPADIVFLHYKLQSYPTKNKTIKNNTTSISKSRPVILNVLAHSKKYHEVLEEMLTSSVFIDVGGRMISSIGYVCELDPLCGSEGDYDWLYKLLKGYNSKCFTSNILQFTLNKHTFARYQRLEEDEKLMCLSYSLSHLDVIDSRSNLQYIMNQVGEDSIEQMLMNGYCTSEALDVLIDYNSKYSDLEYLLSLNAEFLIQSWVMRFSSKREYTMLLAIITKYTVPEIEWKFPELFYAKRIKSNNDERETFAGSNLEIKKDFMNADQAGTILETLLEKILRYNPDKLMLFAKDYVKNSFITSLCKKEEMIATVKKICAIANANEDRLHELLSELEEV